MCIGLLLGAGTTRRCVVADDIMVRRGRLAEEAIDMLIAQRDILTARYEQLRIVAERLANSDPYNDQPGWEYAVMAYEDLVRGE